MDKVKPAARWLKSSWDDEDVLFFFEADDDGWVLRQVELCGPARTPSAASALAESPAGRDSIDAVWAYEATYGRLVEQPFTQWDPSFPYAEIDRAEFEAVWARARAHLENRDNDRDAVKGKDEGG